MRIVWRATAIALGVLVVLLAVAGIENRRLEMDFAPTTYGTMPFGYKALFDLLRESGVPAERSIAAAADLPDGATVWWIRPFDLCHRPADDDEPRAPWDGLSWLERGGTALMFLGGGTHPDPCAAIAGFALPARAARSPADGKWAEDDPTAEIAGGGGDMRSIEGAVVSRPRLLAPPDLATFADGGDWTVIATAAERPFALERTVGAGRLVVLADAGFLSNSWLDRADAAPLAMDLVRAFGPPLLDEHEHGHGKAGALEKLTASPAAGVFAGLLLLGAAFAWWGAALPPRTAAGAEAPAPTLADYVDSLAVLYARSGDHAAAAVQYRDFTLAQLRRRLSLPADTPAAAVAARLERHGRLAAEDLDLLRREPRVASAAELRQTAEALDAVRRKACR